MFLKFFRKALANIREVFDMGLFAMMSDEDIFYIFNGSPLFFVLLPVLGFLITLQALVNGYELLKAANKNFDKWLGFIVSTLCAALASISLYGAAASAYFELNFAIGPWFFLASIGVALAHQLAMMGVNLYRVFESLPNSSQRAHYIQAVLNNLFTSGLLAFVAGAVAFVMISPVAPAFGAACALTVVGFTAASILWRIIPHNWKLGIKAVFGLGKPNEEQQLVRSSELNPLEQVNQQRYQGIFTKCDYRAVIKAKSIDEGIIYLEQVIKQKIQLFNNNPLPHSDKNKQKKALLRDVLTSFKDEVLLSKKALLKHYPLAFQSFWAEKGDVEQIVDAVLFLKVKYLQTKSELQDTAKNSIGCTY